MRNASNLIRVRRCNAVETNKVTKPMLPKLALINARSLLPKVDELIANLSVNTVNLVAVTETWLNDDIEDNLVSIRGYNIFRRDRLIDVEVGFVSISLSISMLSFKLTLKTSILSAYGSGYAPLAYLDPSQALQSVSSTTHLGCPNMNITS